VIPFGTAQDHKRAFDGDEGPNTGGHGRLFTRTDHRDAMSERVHDEIIRPTVAALAHRGIVYRGVLFAGLMIDAEGPKLIDTMSASATRNARC
jgi:phosphoribosylamine--glycine ligase